MQIQMGDWRTAFLAAIRDDSPGSSFITDAEWNQLAPLSNEFVRGLIRRWNNSVADWGINNSNLSSSIKVCDPNEKINFEDFVAFKSISDQWIQRLRSTNASNVFQRADQLVREAKSIIDQVKINLKIFFINF